MTRVSDFRLFNYYCNKITLNLVVVLAVCVVEYLEAQIRFHRNQLLGCSENELFRWNRTIQKGVLGGP